MKGDRWSIFVNSVFFVLGFSIVFSILGIILQTVLINSAYNTKVWLGYIGGIVIIFFGLYLLKLVRIGFLEREHSFKIKSKFRYSYLTSFINSQFENAYQNN